MEKINVKVFLDEGAIAPKRAHEADAGMDLMTRDSVIVPARGSVAVDTGVHIAIPFGYVGFLKSKSGLNVKHSIQSEGVIDSGYTGSIVAKLYNHGDADVYLAAGNKITQLVILPIPNVELEFTDAPLENTERGNGGFGSTGV